MVYNIRIVPGRNTAMADEVSFLPWYKKRGEEVTAHVVVEIDHDGLIDLMKKAAGNKSQKSKDGPVTVKLSRVRPMGRAGGGGR
jgi:hypothetical protein